MDSRSRPFAYDLRLVRLQPWKVWLLAALGGALALALTVAVAGLFLVLVPLFLVGGLVARLLLGAGRPKAPPPPPTAREPGVIEGRYEVVDLRRDDRQPR
jgi:hypothetical protein